MKKKISFFITVIFFSTMLLGTFLHKKIDAIFRTKVQVVSVQLQQEEITANILLDGEEIEVLQIEEFFLLPKQAVKDNQVYIIKTIVVPYGSYQVVKLQDILVEGEQDDMVKVKQGISEDDQVVQAFSENLEDGMRVIVRP